jgi:Ca2+-binding RTX toxin-like protein
MATFTVTTAADVVNAGDGVLSLREAVERANATDAVDSIVFAGALEGSTLTLTSGQLFVNNATNIDGDRNNDGVRVTIDGNSQDRIFRVVGESNFSDLNIVNGMVDSNNDGGGMLVLGDIDVSIDNCLLQNCSAGEVGTYGSGRGGALFVESSRLTISDTTFQDNYSYTSAAIGANEATLAIRSSRVVGHVGYFVQSAVRADSSSVTMENTILSDNSGSALSLVDSEADVYRSQLLRNSRGLFARDSELSIANTTVANNHLRGPYTQDGAAGLIVGGTTTVSNSTITGNINTSSYGELAGNGGGIVSVDGILELRNSILAGNTAYNFDFVRVPSDLIGEVTLSNGHNIFGTDVLGNVPGDRENVAGSTLFASLDPTTGGGLADAAGIVPLKASVTNPAIGGADRFAIGSTDQVGTPRPSPTGTNPDAGAAESGFAPSTVSSANNDTLTGTAAANTLNGQAGHDFLKGLGGADTLNGGDGGDFLEGSAGNDRINGGTGIDTVNYGDSSTRVVVDLRGDAASDTDTAKRGSETDTLTGIEGAIGGGGNDVFYGDNAANWFQGGLGKDTFTGGSRRDTYDYNLTSASPVGAGRDVITDFDHLVDKIDLAGIDADSTVAGNQAFRWVGTDALTGPGELGYVRSGGDIIVRLSTDTDAASEAAIQLTAINMLSALDFYL